jgi:dolichol-phosphate mannosyltransferase
MLDRARLDSAIQAAKFCIVGGSGYVVNLTVYSILLELVGLNYVLAALGAFAVAVVNNYTWNRLWTFSASKDGIASEGLRFVAVAGGALGANVALLHAFVGLGIAAIPAQAGAILLATPMNYLGCKLWAFRDASRPAAGSTEPSSRQDVLHHPAPSLTPRLTEIVHSMTRCARASSRGVQTWIRSRASTAVIVRFLGFCFIVLNGSILYTALFAAGTEWLHMPFKLSGFLATEVITLWSFVFFETWIFFARSYARARAERLALFFLVTHVAIAGSAPFLLMLSALGVNYLPANVLSVALLTVGRYALSDAWIWGVAPAARLAPVAERPLLKPAASTAAVGADLGAP